MADGLEMLMATGQGYQPLVTGAPPPRLTGMEGVPFLGSGGGPFQTLVGLGMTPFYQRMLGNVGMFPTGIGHDRNIADVMRHMQFVQLQQQAMRQAAETDRTTFMQTMQGMAALTGTPFGAQQQQAASTLVSGMVAAAPIMATIMPDFYDSLGGLRGSAAVLANRTMDAGRYRIDPLTGRMGVSDVTAGFTAQRLMNDLYSDQNISRMQGISAGRLGDLARQLQHRGMLAGAESEAGYAGFAPGSPFGETRRAVDYMHRFETEALGRSASAAGVDLSKGFEKLTATDLDKLMAQPDVGNRMRAFDSDRIKKSLQNYVDVIAAMKDIFGEAGQPNAPLPMLIQGLEALTAGSAHQIDPSRLNMIVRDVHNLSRNSGVSMNGVMMMQQHAAMRAQEIGVAPIFAASATNQALAWAGAYNAGGHGAHQAFGLMTSDQLRQLKANMIVNAAGSETGNRLAVLRRVSGLVGGFEQGTELAAIDAAVAAGRSDYEFGGETRTLRLSQEDLIRHLTTGTGQHGTSLDLTSRDVQNLLGQRNVNQEYIDRDGIQQITAKMQPGEITQKVISPAMLRVLTGDIAERLVTQGVSEPEAAKQALKLAQSVSDTAVKRIGKLSTAEFRGANHNLLIGNIIAQELQRTGAAEKLGLTGDDLNRFSVMTGETFHGAATEDLRNGPWSGVQNIVNWHALQNETIENRAIQNQWQARLESERQTALSPFGRGTSMQRFFEALRNSRPDDDAAFSRLMAETFGGVDTQKLSDALRKPMTDAVGMDAAITKKIEEIQKSTDPAQRAQLEEQLRRMQTEFRGQVTTAADIGTKFGYFSTPGITKDETKRAIRVDKEMQDTVSALTPVVIEADNAKRRAMYDRLWQSPGGTVARRMVDRFTQDMGNIAYGLVATPEMAHRMGDRAIELSERLTTDQDRLNSLALIYANGDISRLMLGDVALPAGEERDNMLKEVGAIRSRAEKIFKYVDEQHGAEAKPISQEEKDRLTTRQKAALDSLTNSGESSLRAIHKAFGINTGEQLTPDQMRVASMLGSGVSRSFARTALWSQEVLSKAAETAGTGTGNEGIDNLSYDYLSAMDAMRNGDASKMESFRAGFKGGDFAAFERALQFQHHTGLLNLNRGGGDQPVEVDLERMLENMRGGGDLMRASSAGGAAGPMQINGTMKGKLTVDIVNGTADLDATYGGARAFTQGGG